MLDFFSRSAPLRMSRSLSNILVHDTLRMMELQHRRAERHAVMDALVLVSVHHRVRTSPEPCKLSEAWFS